MNAVIGMAEAPDVLSASRAVIKHGASFLFHLVLLTSSSDPAAHGGGLSGTSLSSPLLLLSPSLSLRYAMDCKKKNTAASNEVFDSAQVIAC